MAHEVETMAFANEVPWHGLGNRVDANSTIDEMLVAAGLDWEVKQYPLYAKIGDKELAVTRKALVRETDHKVLTVTGENWTPLQNRDALGFFREYTEAGGIKLETAGSLRGGKVIWGLANIGEGFTIMNGRDAVKGYMLITSPHEVGHAISVRTTSVRVVCANTMAMAHRGASQVSYTQNHLSEFDMDRAKETIGLARETIRDYQIDAEALMGLKMSEYDTVRFLAKFFQPTETKPALEKVIKDPTARNKHLTAVINSVQNAPGATPGNAWGVLNGVTHWADHVSGRSNDARVSSAWFGVNSRMKLNVNTELLEMAA